ncbi:N/A [soil metagenome]
MAEPRALILIGTGGNTFDVVDLVDAINAIRPTWRVIGFLDDAKPLGAHHCDLPVLGRVREASRFSGGAMFINAIGSDKSFRHRGDIVRSTGLHRDNFATLIHPLAAISARALLGRGSYVCAHAWIGGEARIGDHVIVCPGAIVGHESIIDDHSVIAPGACISGAVRVGLSSYVGARAVIGPRATLAAGTLVGMGAVVIHPVVEASIMVGNPARAIRPSVAAPN